MRISLKTEDTGLDGADQICFAAPGEAVRWMIRLALLSVSVFVMAGCKRSVSEMPVGPAVAIKVPLGLPPVPIPANNPPTAATIALGRKLFYDMRLSQDNSIACASCHSPQLDFTDGLARSRGVRGMTGVRNAPTIVNSAYLPLQFWDGRAVSLEEQAASPIANPVEMNQSHDVSVSKLAEDPG
jgi:cytochrome c peroxidase